MANIYKIKKDVENLFKQYLRDELPPTESSSSSSPSSISNTYSGSSNSSSDRDYNYLTGMTGDEFALPAITIICQEANMDILSYNWDCLVEIGIWHHYADSTRAIHNDKVAEIRDKLIVDSEDLCTILNTNTLGIDAMLYTPTESNRSVEGKKWLTVQSLTLKCNYLG